MKHKTLSRILAVVMCATLVLAGCGKNPDTGNAGQREEKQYHDHFYKKEAVFGMSI